MSRLRLLNRSFQREALYDSLLLTQSGLGWQHSVRAPH